MTGFRAVFAAVVVLAAVALAACTPTDTKKDSMDSTATFQLWEAVDAQDAAAASRAIDAGADIEARGEQDRTPLIAATKHEDVETARVLLHAGADPNAQDAIQDSAFLYAGAQGLDDIVELTLEHGADVTSTNRFGGTALIPASERAHLSTMRILIDAGVPLDHVNRLGWTALHEAIVLGDGGPDHLSAVHLLLDAGADPELPDGDGTSPRELAASRGYSKIVAAIDAATDE